MRVYELTGCVVGLDTILLVSSVLQLLGYRTDQIERYACISMHAANKVHHKQAGLVTSAVLMHFVFY
jgi:hypothetical protein